jgi:hypothetical protein
LGSILKNSKQWAAFVKADARDYFCRRQAHPEPRWVVYHLNEGLPRTVVNGGDG